MAENFIQEFPEQFEIDKDTFNFDSVLSDIPDNILKETLAEEKKINENILEEKISTTFNEENNILKTENKKEGVSKLKKILNYTEDDIIGYKNNHYTDKDIVNLKHKIALYYEKFGETILKKYPQVEVKKINDPIILEIYLEKIRQTINYSNVDTIIEDQFFNILRLIETVCCEFKFDISGYANDTEKQYGSKIKNILSQISIEYFDYYQYIGNPLIGLAMILSISMYGCYKKNKNKKAIENSIDTREELFDKYKEILKR